MHIGEVMKKYRLEKGYTQEDMAERLYISRPYYTSIERGNKVPNILLAGEIAVLLGVTLDELLRDGKG